jgi:hypothetical protein
VRALPRRRYLAHVARQHGRQKSARAGPGGPCTDAGRTRGSPWLSLKDFHIVNAACAQSASTFRQGPRAIRTRPKSAPRSLWGLCASSQSVAIDVCVGRCPSQNCCTHEVLLREKSVHVRCSGCMKTRSSRYPPERAMRFAEDVVSPVPHGYVLGWSGIHCACSLALVVYLQLVVRQWTSQRGA